jgi:hypothetical protein
MATDYTRGFAVATVRAGGEAARPAADSTNTAFAICCTLTPIDETRGRATATQRRPE